MLNNTMEQTNKQRLIPFRLYQRHEAWIPQISFIPTLIHIDTIMAKHKNMFLFLKERQS